MKPGVMVNLTKPEAIDLAKQIMNWCIQKNISYYLLPDEGEFFCQPSLSPDQWRHQVDIALVVGGDGTFLRAARRVRDCGGDVPLFGFNVGHLGFLAAGKVECLHDQLEALNNGLGTLSRRRLLDGQVCKGDQVSPFYALNDMVVFKGCQSKMISLEVLVRGRQIATLRADGLIVSTPTGSTAYALSAGGPMVAPHVPCLILAPICAHTLYWRPLVLSDEDQVQLRFIGDQEGLYSVDGLDAISLQKGDCIDIGLSHHSVSFVTLPDGDYFDVLNQKLMWGYDPVNSHA